MKCKIVQESNKIKTCDCGHQIFRKSTKSRYTNCEKTEGMTYALIICDKCNRREQFNTTRWRVKQ